MSTNRLESFSDGVLAVAITLLVLDIKVPPPLPGESPSLVHSLLRQWPAYAAYGTSFITIGIIWINHHVMIGRLRETDHAILVLNLVLLLTIGVIPFATSLLADYLREPHGAKVAAAVYGGVFLAMSIAFTGLNRHILFRKAHLLTSSLPLELRRKILFRSITGVGPYVVATALAAVSPYATLAIMAALATYYAFPAASGARVGPG